MKTILIILFCFLAAPAFSQVTVGMSEAPAKTALLQIKSQPADGANATSKTGGFLPPRVELVKLRTLQPFMLTTDAGYTDEKRLATGMLVYNVATIEADTISPGYYYWDGERWDKLLMRSDSIGGGGPGGNNGSDTTVVEPIPDDPSDPTALDLSNCYIVRPGQTVKIPVMKAYAVWKQKLMDSELDNASGDRFMNLVWEDRVGVINGFTPKIPDTGYKSAFGVTGGKPGNAVISMSIGGVVYWSWHIWVTDYNPETDYKEYNDLLFMDRALGATSNTFGALGSVGLLYQWGRKDPFPGAATTTSGTEKLLYSAIDIIHPVVRKVDNTTLTDPNNNFLRASIKNPLTFYYSTAPLADWYTTLNDDSAQNDDLWYDGTLTKTPYDPCPPGWRVAYVTTRGNSPFAGLPQPGNFSDGTGVDGNLGYSSAAGYRMPATPGDPDPVIGQTAPNFAISTTHPGESSVGIEGHYWNATIVLNEPRAYNLHFEPYFLLDNDLQARASGASVRCVKPAPMP